MLVRLRVETTSAVPPTLDIAISAPPGTTLREILPAVDWLCQGVPRHARWAVADLLDGSLQEVRPDSRLGAFPLIDGAELRSATARQVEGNGLRGPLRLRVCEGPDSGRVYALNPGTHTIGRSPTAEVRLEDSEISRAHAEITIEHGHAYIRDLHSANGTSIGHERLGPQPQVLTPSERVHLGQTTLQLCVLAGARRPRHGDDAGHLVVQRGPRLDRRPEAARLQAPEPPSEPQHRPIPVVAVLVPLAAALGLTALLHNPSMLLFGVMSPLMMLSNVVGERRQGRRVGRTAAATHQTALRVHDEALQGGLRAERAALHRWMPDLSEVHDQACTAGSRLWQRRSGDADFLRLRLGRGTVPAALVVVAADGEHHPPLQDAPVVLDLPTVGSLGLVGEREAVLGGARAILAQVAAWHPPDDVRLVLLLADRAREPAWAWWPWLPHTRDGTTAGRAHVSSTGSDSDETRRQIRELRDLVLQRAERGRSATKGEHEPAVLVVLDDAASIAKDLPAVGDLVRDGPTHGIYVITLGSARDQLPGSIGAVMELGRGRLSTYQGQEWSPLEVVVDRVGGQWMDRVARALAPLTVAAAGQRSAPPERIDLLDLLDIDATDPAALARGWRADGRSTAAVVGAGADGAVVLDLVRDGPHALLGGTTGSGKSELLRTLVTSLAVSNSPAEMIFVLVDYKGGAAFSECARLPHTVGLVTDLDPHLAQRALDSLRSELRRREGILAQAGVRDLAEYQQQDHSAHPPLPRLVLVIDEFRALAEELPGFVDGLVRIAALGRSLGIHLVLATQRPGGIVSADIRANVSLRIALRVRDRVDSQDVIECSDAAQISPAHPGRALARDSGGVLTLFQGARTSRVAAPIGAESVLVRPCSFSWMDDLPACDRAEPEAPGPTDLSRIVEAARDSSQMLGVTAVPSPWLPPLPTTVTNDDLIARASSRSRTAPGRPDPTLPDSDPTEPDLPASDLPSPDLPSPDLASPPGSPDPAPMPYAVVDLPHQQRREHARWSLAGDGHLALVGQARSGRTTAARTICATMAAICSTEQVELFVYDGSGGLGILTELPHTAVVVGRHERERWRRVIERLHQEVARRRQVLARDGFGSILEQRRDVPHDERMSYLVVVVDGWESFVSAHEEVDHGASVESLLRLLREGLAFGVRALLTGDRSLLRSQVAATVSERVYLRLSDPTDLALAGLSPRQVPHESAAGRGLRGADGAELQMLLLAADPSAAAQCEVVRAIAAARTDPAGRTTGTRPANQRRRLRIDALPTSLHLADLPEPSLESSGAALIPIGVGGDELAPVRLRLGSTARSVLVLGPPGSGRSSALRLLVAQLGGLGQPVAVIADAAGSPDAAGWGSAAVLDYAQGEELARLLDDAPDLVVAIDDIARLGDGRTAEALLDRARPSHPGAGGVLCALAPSQMAGAFRGVAVEIARGGVGIVLNATSGADGDCLGVRVRTDGDQVPGRGFLAQRGRLEPVQLAMPVRGSPGRLEPDLPGPHCWRG